MRKFALILASSAFGISTAGIGAAFAQTTTMPAQPDAAATDTAKPVAKKAAHQKVAMNKQKAKAPKKMAPKHPAAEPAEPENPTE
jgi:hypothetical protein